MKRIAIISIIAAAIFSGYCYSANAEKTARLYDMAATAIVDGVCIGGDMEGLACIQ